MDLHTLVCETVQLDDEARGECPFCGVENAFALYNYDTLYACDECGRSGNIITYLVATKGLTNEVATVLVAQL